MAHNGGRLQVNLWTPSFSSDKWAISSTKQAFPFDARDNSNAVPINAWPTYLDADGYPTQMPDSPATKWWMPQVHAWGAVGESWDLIYPSQHTVAFQDQSGQITYSSEVIAPGHKRYTITSVTSSTTSYIGAISVTAMSGSDWTGGVQFFKNTAQNQTDISAGKYFGSEFLARLGYPGNAVGTIRFMDWCSVNDSLARDLRAYRGVGSSSWSAPNYDGAYYAGTVTVSNNAYTTSAAIPGSPTSWTDGQPITFFLSTKLAFLHATSITKGATTTLGITGHGLSNGAKLRFAQTFNGYGTGWQNAVEEPSTVTGVTPEFTVTIVDPDTITIDLASTGFGTLNSAYVYQSMTITDGTLPAKKCLSGYIMNFGTGDLQAANTTLITGTYNADFDAVIIGSGTTNSGVPIEAMCVLSNEIKANPWFCVPQLMNSAGMQAFAQEVYNNLDSDLTPIFELGNEVWNGGFKAFRQARSISALQLGQVDQRYGYGYGVVQMADAIAAVFTGKPYRIAFGQQNVGPTGAGPWFECSPLSSGNPALYPINRCDIIAPAPYYLPAFTYSATAADYTGYQSAINSWLAGDTATAFAWVATELKGPAGGTPGNQQIDVHLSTYLPAWLVHADNYSGRNGLTVECYEGGIHIIGPDYLDGGFPAGGITAQNVQDFWFAYLESEEHAGVMHYYLEKQYKLGVKPSIYCITAPWNGTNVWGAQRLNSVAPTQTPQHAAMMRWNQGVYRYRLTTS